jgi:predicted nucleotidyltransferase
VRCMNTACGASAEVAGPFTMLRYSSNSHMTAPDREALLTRIVHTLERDARVAAAWLAGSIGRGEDDTWSDLDLHVAVYDEHLATFWADRDRLYERIGRPVLIQQEMPSNAQAGGHFQLSSLTDLSKWTGTSAR